MRLVPKTLNSRSSVPKLPPIRSAGQSSLKRSRTTSRIKPITLITKKKFGANFFSDLRLESNKDEDPRPDQYNLKNKFKYIRDHQNMYEIEQKFFDPAKMEAQLQTVKDEKVKREVMGRDPTYVHPLIEKNEEFDFKE